MTKSRKTKDVSPGKEKLSRRTAAEGKGGKTASAIARDSSAVSSVASSDGRILDRLHQVILQRRNADPSLSHSARLLARGQAKVAQKFGEEAVEALIEGLGSNRLALIAESADVLYHLLLMWVACDVAPQAVWDELTRRQGVSGLMEKAARSIPRHVATRKIP